MLDKLSSVYSIGICQQQQSLLSQASWGRLEMKPKRHKCHGSGTLIASLQALLSKANSSEISQYFVGLNQLFYLNESEYDFILT